MGEKPMTDTMELVRKLEAGDVSLKTTRAAAACIREMVERQSGGHTPAVPDDHGFIHWAGGENPCPGRRVDAVWLGEVHPDQASDDLEWAHSDICDHITSYRVLPPAPGAEA